MTIEHTVFGAQKMRNLQQTWFQDKTANAGIMIFIEAIDFFGDYLPDANAFRHNPCRKVLFVLLAKL